MRNCTSKWCPTPNRRSSLAEYELSYSADLDHVLHHLARLLRRLYASISATSVQTQALFTSALEIFHGYLLLASALQHYTQSEEEQTALDAMQTPSLKAPQNNLWTTLTQMPDLLDFLTSLLSTTFAHNPYFTEMVNSSLESILISALPCPPVVSFVRKLLSPSETLDYHALTLLHSACKSSALVEALSTTQVTATATATAEAETETETDDRLKSLYKQLSAEGTPRARLTKLFCLYLLCRNNSRNKSRLEELLSTIGFVNSFKYADYNENQQLFILSIFHNLANGNDNVHKNAGTFAYQLTVDYRELVSEMDLKDIELAGNIREELRGPFYELTKSAPRRGRIPLESGVRPTKLLNVFVLLLIDSPPSLQAQVKYDCSSLPRCWM
jgi:hypothetical protein